MKAILTFLFLTTIIYIGSSQDTIKIYLDENFEITDKLNAITFREVIIENNLYKFTDKDLEGKMINYCEFSSVEPKIEGGFAKHYQQADILYSSGNYNNGEMIGPWVYRSNDNTDTVFYKTIAEYEHLTNCNFDSNNPIDTNKNEDSPFLDSLKN